MIVRYLAIVTSLLPINPHFEKSEFDDPLCDEVLKKTSFMRPFETTYVLLM